MKSRCVEKESPGRDYLRSKGRSTRRQRHAKGEVPGTVQATIVLAGVNSDGETRFAFIQQSCEDKALDAEALTFIHALRFAPSAEALQWGTVTIEWGDEVTAPATPK